MKKHTYLLGILLFVSFYLQAQQLTKTFTFATDNLSFSQKDGYDVINMTGTNHITDELFAGQPQLPVKSFNLLLPQGARATNVSFDNNQHIQLTGDFNLYPVQPPYNEEEPIFVEQDTETYTSNEAFPQNKILDFNTNQYREYSYVNIFFYPLFYLPADQKVSLITELTITVDYDIINPNQEYKLRPYNKTDKFAYQSIQNKVLNFDEIDNFYPITKNKLTAYSNKSVNIAQSKAFIPTDLPALAGSVVKYVIITNNTDIFGNPVLDETGNPYLLTEKFQEFADWKTQNGTPAKVVTVDAIRANYQGVDIPEKIREFIKDAVALWGAEYVLLGGVANIIPTRFSFYSSDGTKMSTNLYYAAINGNNWNADGDTIFGEPKYWIGGHWVYQDLCDFIPDIAVGRVAVDTEKEMDLFLKKNYIYARSIQANSIDNADIPTGDFLNKQLNIGGIVTAYEWPTNPWNTGLALPTFWYIETEFSDDSEQYTMLEYKNNWNNLGSPYNTWGDAYNPTIMDAKIYSGGLDHDDIVTYISDNKPGIIFHTDHSGPHNKGLTEHIHSTTGLNEQDWHQGVESTTNRYPIMISGGCHTAPVERSFFVGGEWLNAPGGGIAYIGTSETVGEQISYSFSQRFFDVLYTNNDIHTIGDIMNEASFISTNQVAATDNLKEQFKAQRLYQLIGDPELMVFTNNPADEPLTVSHSMGTLTTGKQNYEVTASWSGGVEFASISLYKKDEVLAVQKEAVNGQTYTFDITPDTTGDLQITVTRYNADPYEYSLAIPDENPTVHLYKSNIKIYEDAAGNNEIFTIQPGQTVYLKIELSNTGDNEADSINAELIMDGNVISTSTYPKIISEASSENNTLYTFTAPTNLEYGTDVNLTLKINQNGTIFTEDFFLNTKSAKLDIGDRVVSVGGTPTENGVFSNGDEIELKIFVDNYSSIDTNITQATLSLNPESDIQNVVFDDPNQAYGVIAGYGKADKTFHLTINEDCDTESFLLFLTLTDEYGNTNQFDINLSEDSPEEINDFDFVSEEQAITLKWRNANWTEVWDEDQDDFVWKWVLFDNIKGNNVYRLNENTGNYEKINDFLLTSPIFYDKNRTVLTDYQYKISVVSDTGNEKDLTNISSHYTWTSLERHTGFPQTTSTNVAVSSYQSILAVYDINDDGYKEIFSDFKQYQRSRIMAYKHDGTELFDIDTADDKPTGFAEIYGRTYSYPTIGDIDADGFIDIISSSIQKHPRQGYIHALSTEDDGSANPTPLWSINLDGSLDYDFIMSNSVIADINQDGFKELVFIEIGHKMAVYSHDGSLLWDKTYESSGAGEIAIVDLDDDGYQEIIVGVNKYDLDGKGAICIYDYQGNLKDIYKFETNESAASSVVVSDLDNDQDYEILISTKISGAESKIYAFDIDTQMILTKLWDYTFDYQDEGIPKISVGDLNNDALPDICFVSTLNYTHGSDKLCVLNANGSPFSPSYFPIEIKEYSSVSRPILADIDDDNYIEIIVNAGGDLYAFNSNDGTECPYWRLSTGVSTNPIYGTPYIGDIDKDGINEVVANASNCETYVWDTTGDSNKIPWGSHRVNAQNTGVTPSSCEIVGQDVVINNGLNTNKISNNKYISGDLIIKDNSILTISPIDDNIDISFTENSKIIIEKGSKLIIEGIIVGGFGNKIVNLKSDCGTHWKGIIVKGDPTATQTEANQGVLEIGINVTIQDAEIAIYVGGESTTLNKGESEEDPTPDEFSGGIIKIDGGENRTVNFINNISGIEMPQYTQDNSASYIKNCQFTTTTDYNHITYPDTFITLWNVGTIDIFNNKFTNENPPIGLDGYNRGMGIVATDADLNITQNNEFTGLYYAIKIQGTGQLNTLEIDDNTFATNSFGIYLSNADGAVITNNDIGVFSHSCMITSGILLLSSNSFTVEDNTLTKENDNLSTGILVDNCESSNSIYNNKFLNLYTGIIASGNNVDSTVSFRSEDGLKILCNEFDTVDHDIYVSFDSTINSNQGSSTLAAGNKFLPECSGTTDEFNSIDCSVTYYHRDESPVHTPTCKSDKVTLGVGLTNDCQSHLSVSVREEDISQKDSEINQNNADLQALTDGGDTESLNETVEEADNSEALQLRNELLSKSPTLSDTVMVNTTSIEDVLPALMVKQVLAANPKAAKSNKVQTALDNRYNQLPDYMRTEIDLGRDILSYKEVLESQLSQAIHEREDLINRRIIQLKQEGSTASIDSLETLLINEASNKLSRSYQLVNHYLSKGDNQNAQNLFNAIPTNFNLSSSQQNKYDKFNQIYSIRFSLENANKSWFEMDSIQKQTLYTLAIDSISTAGKQARSIISLVDHITYPVYIPNIDTANNQARYANDAPEMLFKVYPEVTTDYFIVEYVLGKDENPEEVKIAVFDNEASLLKNFEVINAANQYLVECANWKEGTYWCRKSVANKVTEQRQIIINKGGVVIDAIEAKSVSGYNSLVLFPNPTKDYLFVNYPIQKNVSVSMQVTDTKGSVINSYKLTSNLTKINTDKWQSGVYTISIIENNWVVDTAKIIVE